MNIKHLTAAMRHNNITCFIFTQPAADKGWVNDKRRSRMSTIVGLPSTVSSGRGLNVACLRIAKTSNSAFSWSLHGFVCPCEVLLKSSSKDVTVRSWSDPKNCLIELPPWPTAAFEQGRQPRAETLIDRIWLFIIINAYTRKN